MSRRIFGMDRQPLSFTRTDPLCTDRAGCGCLCAWGSPDGRAACRPAGQTRPDTLLVPIAAGGGTDIRARAVGDKLAAELGRPIVVKNQAGANGSIDRKSTRLKSSH